MSPSRLETGILPLVTVSDESEFDPQDEGDPFEIDFGDGLGEDGEVSETVRRRLETLVPELVKKTFSAGLGALFTTEEGVRRLTREMRMPKEVAGYLVNTAAAGKDEVLRVVAGEMRTFLETINLSEEIAKMLTTLSLEVKTEIRFVPNEKKYTGVEPDVKAKVRVKRGAEKRRKRKTGEPAE